MKERANSSISRLMIAYGFFSFTVFEASLMIDILSNHGYISSAFSGGVMLLALIIFLWLKPKTGPA